MTQSTRHSYTAHDLRSIATLTGRRQVLWTALLVLDELKPDYLARLSRNRAVYPNRPFRADGYLHLHVSLFVDWHKHGFDLYDSEYEPRAAADHQI